MNRIIHLAAAVVGLSAAALGAQATDFTVSTTSQKDGRFPQAQFANAMGCTGSNLSPQISWSGAPAGTKSYVVTVYDPDAPTGSGWWHWVVANIPAAVTELKEGVPLPAGAVSVRGDNGMPGYSGICPPPGQTHNYVITVHALRLEKLDLPTTVTPAMLGFMTLGTGLGKATVTIKGAQ